MRASGMAVVLVMTGIAVGCSHQSSAGNPPAKVGETSPAATTDVKKGGGPKVDTSSRREHNRAKAAAKDVP